jgi:hypothetical protein
LILATPTETHAALIRQFENLKIPMLVEKPVTKSAKDLEKILNEKPNIKMVNQYAYIKGESTGGATYYDYFRSGTDGIEWDCINIIGNAEKKASIGNSSPFWTCSINGNQLNLSDMDKAYALMIDDWLRNPKSDLDYIEFAHKRVHEGFYDTCNDWYSSALNKYSISKQSEPENRESDHVAVSDRQLQPSKGIHRTRKQSKDQSGVTSSNG